MLLVSKLSIKLPDGSVMGGVDFLLNRGEVLYLFGPNGCGKSSLLHFLATNATPKIAGEVFIKNIPIEEYFKKKEPYPVSLLFQKHDFADILVYELYDIAIHNSRGIGAISNISEIEKILGIDHLRNRSVNELSGGERQKVYLYSLLLYNPEIFLFDEPYSGLDIPSVVAINTILQKLRENKVMIIALHDLNHIFFDCAKVGVYDNGAFSLFDNVEDFSQNGIARGYLKGLVQYECRGKKFFAY